MASMVKTPGAGLSQGKGGLSQGKGGGASPATAGTLPTHAGGKPVVQGPGIPAGGWKGGEIPQNLDPRSVNIPGHGVSATGAPINNMINGRKFFEDLPDNMDVRSIMTRDQGMPMQRTMGMMQPASSMGSLASLFMGNQGYGGGSGGSLAEITQPTRESMGLPDITKMLSPRAPVQPAAPQPQAPNAQQIQQRIAQMTPGNEMTYGGGMGGSANPLIGGTMGAPAVFDEQYRRMKYQNPAMAQQMLERSPFKSLYAPVQGAAPQQPFQRSQASLMADEINRMAASRR